jgi:SAM-dependent methyltransferase
MAQASRPYSVGQPQYDVLKPGIIGWRAASERMTSDPASPPPSDFLDFTCNLCGIRNRCAVKDLGRESATCSSCGSNVRTRGIIQALSMELFGINLALPDFPRIKSLRGIGTSDSSQYANRLAEKFDYRNTFYDREPRFDIGKLVAEENQYDFLISSEVFEHVPPPAETAFQNAFRLLKPSGVLVLTVPYSIEPATTEHFPELHEFGLVQLGDGIALVNRTKTGEVQVFENVVFHGGKGSTLEMREFTEKSLKALLAGAGFSGIRIYAEDYRPFGIVRSEAWSLPIAARKGPFAFSFEATRDVLEEWRDLRLKFTSEMKRLDGNLWFRVGRKLGLVR